MSLADYIHYRLAVNPGYRMDIYASFLQLIVTAFEERQNGILGIQHRGELIKFTIDDLVAQLIKTWPRSRDALFNLLPGKTGPLAFARDRSIDVNTKSVAVRRYLDAYNQTGVPPHFLLVPTAQIAVRIPRRARGKMRILMELMDLFQVQ